MVESGKLLRVLGGALAGVLRARGGKIPWLARLPGDLILQRETVTIYVPVTTCRVASGLVSLVVFLLRRW